MTEPDPAAALAAQIEELRGQLARYRARPVTCAPGWRSTPARSCMLPAIKQLGQKTRRGDRPACRPPTPGAVLAAAGRQEHAARLAELRDWVERFLRVQYPAYLVKLPPCWENHPEAVWELSNLMTEWVRIYGDPDNRPLQDALWWHERWLPGVLCRLGNALKCDVAGLPRGAVLAVGAIATPLHLIRPRRPRRASPASGAFAMNTDAQVRA